MRTGIFIDGAYLGKILANHHGRGDVAFEKLSAHLAAGDDLLRTYYYDAPPWQSDPPTADESRRFAARQKFFAALRKLSRYEVREGRCQRQWDPNRNAWRYVQKRVDVLFSVDLVRLASKQQIGKAILIAGDSDFLPAVSVAKDDGVLIKVVHSPNMKEIHRELWDAADDRAPFDAAMFAAVKR